MAIQTFDVDIQRIAKKAKVQLETAMHEVIQDINQELVMATPVDTGNLRGSWFVSINSDTGTFKGSPDTSGATTIARMNVGVIGAEVGDVVYLLNGANYASYVEYGTSRMRPRAFVRGTVNRAAAIANRTIARLKRGGI